MKVTALADLPNGVKAGQRFEVPDYQGDLLLRAKVVTRDEDAAAPVKRPPTYRRRDLTAEGTKARNGGVERERESERESDTE